MHSVGNTRTRTPVGAHDPHAVSPQANPTSTISPAPRSVISSHMSDSDALALGTRPNVEQLNTTNAPDRISAFIDRENRQESEPNAQELKQQLMAFSKAVVADDQVELNRGHLQAFHQARRKAIETGDYTEARACLFRVLDFDEKKQEEMIAGFQNAGRVYSFRGSLGSIVNLMPAAMTVMAHDAAPVAARNWAIGRLGAAIGCAIGGGVVNIYALMHLLACHDLSFRQAPNVQPELKTPQFDKIQKDLNELEGHAQNKIEEIKEALEASQREPNNQELKGKVDTLFKETQDMIGAGIHTYLTRCQLNHIFFRGLSSQSLLATCKLYINLAASWVGFATGDPRMNALTQLAGCIVQLVGNYFVGPGDKVTEQLEMIDLKILTADSDEKLKQIFRSPLKIRAFMLEQLFASQIKELDQAISSQLGLVDPNQWRTYAALKDRAEYPGKLSAFQQPRDQAFNSLDASAQGEIQDMESQLASATKERNHERAEELYTDISRKLNISADDYKKYSDLRAQAHAFPALSVEEQDTLDDLSVQVSTGYAQLAPEARIKFNQMQSSWEETRHDPQHVRERRFTDVSSFKENNQIVRNGMQVSDSARAGLFKLSPEFKIGFQMDGRRRRMDPAEMTANYAATAWKTWQWVIGGTYGAVMLNAFLSVLAAEQKTKDPKYEQPLWERCMSTGLVGVVLLVNMVAAYRIISASAKPVNNALRLQMFAGTSGSGMDGTILNRKLKVRDNLRTEINNGGFPYVGLKHEQWGRYIWAAVKESFPGMFAMLQESKHASAAHSAYDKLVATRGKLNTLENQTASGLNRAESGEAASPNANKASAPTKAGKTDNSHYIEIRESDA